MHEAATGSTAPIGWTSRPLNVAQRVAVPLPTSYRIRSSFHNCHGGRLSIVLTPGWFVPMVKDAASLNVIWTPENPR